MVKPEDYLGIAKRIGKDLRKFAFSAKVEPVDLYAQIRLHLVEACVKLNALRAEDPNSYSNTLAFLFRRVRWDTITWLRHEKVIDVYHKSFDVLSPRDKREVPRTEVSWHHFQGVDPTNPLFKRSPFEKVYDRAEVALFMDWAKKNLSALHYEWCVRYYTQGFYAKEIAEDYGVETTAISSAMYRAIHRYRGRFKEPRRIPKNKIHGTVNKYNAGCRCAKCKHAKAQYWRSRNARSNKGGKHG